MQQECSGRPGGVSTRHPREQAPRLPGTRPPPGPGTTPDQTPLGPDPASVDRILDTRL